MSNQIAAQGSFDRDQQARLEAVAHLYHTLFTGLILTVVTRRGTADAARWMEALFRFQHKEKFLSSFEKLGLSDMPHAVAAAAYHYLSNRIGGVEVEFMRESDVKAWVRFPPPRWVYPGAAICGIPSEVSRAMLRGWYAYNGVSLRNPRLGFVCTGQTVDGQPGLMGYFQEFDRDLAPDERLRFRPGEVPPPYDAARAPKLPDGAWPTDRLLKAQRSYAMEYLRSGLPKLFEIFGVAEGLHLGRTAAWLIGAQLSRETASRLGISGTDAASLAGLLAALAEGEGDRADILQDGGDIVLQRPGLRVARGLGPQPDEFFLAWNGLLEGLAAGHNHFLRLEVISRGDFGADAWRWRIAQR
jgi:hypothetical protein